MNPGTTLPLFAWVDAFLKLIVWSVLLVVFFLVFVLPVLLIVRSNRRRKAAAREDEIDRQQAAAHGESQRIEECGVVVTKVLSTVGHMARAAMSRDEVERLIDSGIQPDQLLREVSRRIQEVDGMQLGQQPIGDGMLLTKLPDAYRTRHVYCVGKSGSGKTTLLTNMIRQDMELGNGLAVIAPEHEMLYEEILPFIPEHRLADVVYVNPADTERPIVMNPLQLDEGEDLDLKADETMTIFKRLFDDDGGGVRMDAILRNALYTLMQIPNTTLLDIEKLLERNDDGYRKWAVEQSDDPQSETFWFDTYPAYPKDAPLPIVNRLSRLLRPKVVRTFLCSPGPSLNIRQAMDDKKILLFNLSDGVLGELNAMLLGQLVVAKLQTAAMSRADTAKAERSEYFVYIDEFQTFCGVAATSYEKILSRARKYGLGLTLAHQQTGQVPEHLMREILGNVSTVISFLVSNTDARRIGREMVANVMGEVQALDPQSLLALDVGEAYCKVDRSVFFLETFPPPDNPSARTRDAAIQNSRQEYGVDLAALVEEKSGAKRADAEIDFDPGTVFGT